MRFNDLGLVVGAGTILSPTAGSPRELSLDVSAPRPLALLAAAHLRSPTSGGLAHIRKAAEHWRGGNAALAAMHLTLSRLDRLARPNEDSHRLFLADRLMTEGFGPEIILRALGLDAADAVSKYNPDQPRVPAGSGRTSGEWTTGASFPVNPSPLAIPQSPARGPYVRHQSTPVQRPRSSGPAAAVHHQIHSSVDLQAAPRSVPEQTGQARGATAFHIELPRALFGTGVAPAISPFGDAIKAVADGVEIEDSISKWRELGPKGEIAISEAVEARGWIILARQVYVRTALGLRVEDLMVHIPAGTAGNAIAYDGFIEVKVNGGRYSLLQQAKDALIGSEGGILLATVGGYGVGSKIILETGLANISITYEPD